MDVLCKRSNLSQEFWYDIVVKLSSCFLSFPFRNVIWELAKPLQVRRSYQRFGTEENC